MRNIIFFLALLTALASIGQEVTKVITGKISDGRDPVENVAITIDGKTTSVFSDVEGRYRLRAKVGDKINYTSQGLKTVKIKVEDVTRVLNITMVPDIEELDEVIIEAGKRRSQREMEEDYYKNENIVRTAWGYLDTRRAPGQVHIITEDEINPINLCVLELIRNRLASIIVRGDCLRGGEVFNARNGLGPMIWDVDGVILSNQGPSGLSAPIWIDINNIKRVAIINNLTMSAQYGNLGASGVIVINTIGGSPNQEEIEDRARLRNNYADGLELSREEVAKNAPTYLKELKGSGSFEESKAVFERYRATYSNSPYFLLDAYAHFVDDYKKLAYADDIIEEYFGPYTINPVLMKALAYTYESQKRFEKASDANKDIFILRPNYVQSYMDMANSYRNLKEHRQAASMYARYNYLIEEGFLEKDTIGFDPIMQREFNNLLALEKGAVVGIGKGKNPFAAKEDFEGTRLVFEWNDSEAEFELQFVNPEGQYFKWKHTLANNEELIEQREKNFGYNVTEELLGSYSPGTWKVNVKYLGNKSLTPTYLKTVIYQSYGLPSQSKEVKVFKLDLKNVNQELFSLIVGNNMFSK